MAELEENGTGFRMAIKDFAKRENLMVNTYEIRMIKSLLNSSMFKLLQSGVMTSMALNVVKTVLQTAEES